MVNHVASASKTKTTIAAASIFSVTATSLFALNLPSDASGPCTAEGSAGSTALQLPTNDDGTLICQLTFLPIDSDGDGVIDDGDNQSWTPTIPAGVTKVSALIVGGGGPAVTSTNEYIATGGGGEVVYIDNIADGGDFLVITAGLGTGTSTGLSSVNNQDSGATTTADPGGAGTIPLVIVNASYPVAKGGDSGSGQHSGGYGGALFFYYSYEYATGGGQGGPGILFQEDNTPRAIGIAGGAGVSISSFEEDPIHWEQSPPPPTLGAGGAIYPSSGTVKATGLLSTDGLGIGAGALLLAPDGNGVKDYRGAFGSVVLRYVIPTVSSYTVTFDANGGTGTMSNQTASTATPLTSNGFNRSGHTFAGWSTSPSGSVEYAQGASFPFSVSDTLYAIWTLNSAAPANLAAPASSVMSVIDVSPTNVNVKGQIITVLGDNLNSATLVYIGGIKVPILTQSGNRLQFIAPSGLSGLVDLEIKSSLNGVLLIKKLNFGSVAVSGTSRARIVVGGFDHNSDKLTKKMRSEIRLWLAKHPALTTITCTGFTSLPRRTTDVELSTDRGIAACEFALKRRSELVSSVSQGIEDPRPGSNVRRIRLVLTP